MSERYKIIDHVFKAAAKDGFDMEAADTVLHEMYPDRREFLAAQRRMFDVVYTRMKLE